MTHSDCPPPDRAVWLQARAQLNHDLLKNRLRPLLVRARNTASGRVGSDTRIGALLTDAEGLWHVAKERLDWLINSAPIALAPSALLGRAGLAAHLSQEGRSRLMEYVDRAWTVRCGLDVRIRAVLDARDQIDRSFQHLGRGDQLPLDVLDHTLSTLRSLTIAVSELPRGTEF